MGATLRIGCSCGAVVRAVRDRVTGWPYCVSHAVPSTRTRNGRHVAGAFEGPRWRAGEGGRSSGVAVFVDETAEHVCPFDPPDLFDACPCRFRRPDWNVETDA